MLKLSREFYIGIFTIVALGLMVVGFNYMLGIDLFASNKEYVVYYKTADGLTPSSPVTYKGVKVGLVKDIEFVGDNQDSIMVRLRIDHGQFVMKKKTKATLGSDGFLGGSKINLEFIDLASGNAKQGDTLVSDIEVGIEQKINEQVAPLKKKAEDLIGTIDSVITTVTAFWDESTADNLSQSVAGVKRAILQFERTAIKLDTLVYNEQARLHRIFKNVESITTNLSENNETITTSLKNIATFSEEVKDVKIQAAITKAEDVLTKLNLVVGQINSGDGTLGNLIYNDSLHSALLETNATLQLLVNDIRNYPNRYIHFSVFGSREKTPKLNSAEEKKLKEILDLKEQGDLRRFTDQEWLDLRNKVFGSGN